MARFKYEGRSANGKTTGTIVSGSKREAMLNLHKKGIRVANIHEVPESFLTKEITIGNPVRLQDMVIYLRQFATLIKAGVSIVDSTSILAQQTTSKALEKALIAMEDDLRTGNALSQAASKHKKIFSNMFINMVKAGETSGTLDETLDRLATHFEKQHKTRQKIQTALAYPIAVGIIAVFVVAFLLISVVPTFVTMFEGFDGELPAITHFVLAASNWMQSFWWLAALLFILFFVLLSVLKRKAETRYYLDFIKLRIPIFGNLIQKAALARMTRTLSSLFSSSVPILQSLSIVENVVENEVIARVLKQSRNSLEKGVSLTEPMKKHWAFPPLLIQMIAIGEETGALDEMLGKVADFYEEEVEQSTDKMKSLIEPLMIVVLAGLVGTIVTAIIVPMFDMFNHIG